MGVCDTRYVYTASGNIQCEQTCCILHMAGCGILYKHSQVFSPSLTSQNIKREICTGDLLLDVNSICEKLLHTGLTQLSTSTLGCVREYSNLNSLNIVFWILIFWTESISFIFKTKNITGRLNDVFKDINNNPKNITNLSSCGYYSFALSTFAPVKYGTFAQKMTHLPRDFWHICSKNSTFALVKKGTFAQKKKQIIMYICNK